MIKDHYNISSNFRPKKSAYNSNVEDFFKGFEDFYTKVLMKKTPDLPHKICDPYGFSMLCEDYKPVFGSIKHDGNPSCHDAFLNVWETPYDSLYKFKFPFKILLDLLYRGYYFNYDLAMSIYNMQKNPLSIFEQIMNGHGYVINRLKPNKKKVGKLMNYAYESKITLNENRQIDIPYKHRVCDGKTWPCIISESFNGAVIKKDDTDGFGEGLFVVNDKNHIIDCLKINDLWVVDTPLENRLTFGVHSRNYDIAPYMKAFSWRSAFNAGEILGLNKNDGILVRPCYENFFKTSWFEWSKTSLLYCCNINGKLQISNRKSSKPDFYTLEGDLGEVNPYEERIYERIWLDDFDIQEFQQILSLGD